MLSKSVEMKSPSSSSSSPSSSRRPTDEDDSSTFMMVDTVDLEQNTNVSSNNDNTKSQESGEDISIVPSLSVKLTPKHSTIGSQASHTSTNFCTTVYARDLPEDDDDEVQTSSSKRAPVDIVVALDISGSMSGTKLKLCKETLKILLRELGSKDRFGLVTFSDEAKIQISPRNVTTEFKESAMQKIMSLTTEGCTNLSGGIALAAQELLFTSGSVEKPNSVQTIFLLTDGIANRGVTDKDGIVELTKAVLHSKSSTTTSSSSSIGIHCFGYGSDHDQVMLSEIANVAEGGTYYFVQNDSDVLTAFGDALGGVLSVVAQNVILHISVPQEALTHGVRILNIHHDRATKLEDGSYRVEIGDFYAEEVRDVLLEVSLNTNQVENEIKAPHISVVVSYMDTIRNKFENSSQVIGFINRPPGCEVSEADHHVLSQSMRIMTTKLISEANNLASKGDIFKAQEKITHQIIVLRKTISSIKEENPPPLLTQLLNDLIGMEKGLSSRYDYESFGSKNMMQVQRTHVMQRCMFSPAVAEEEEEGSQLPRVSTAYGTSKKRSMISKFSLTK